MCLQCTAQRVTSGSAFVLPELRRRIPLTKTRPALRWAVMPAVLTGTAAVAVAEPVTLWALVPGWLAVAYRLGHHGPCLREEAEDDFEEGSEAAENSENNPEGQ